jgi:hypothetical protein
MSRPPCASASVTSSDLLRCAHRRRSRYSSAIIARILLHIVKDMDLARRTAGLFSGQPRLNSFFRDEVDFSSYAIWLPCPVKQARAFKSAKELLPIQVCSMAARPRVCVHLADNLSSCSITAAVSADQTGCAQRIRSIWSSLAGSVCISLQAFACLEASCSWGECAGGMINGSREETAVDGATTSAILCR